MSEAAAAAAAAAPPPTTTTKKAPPSNLVVPPKKPKLSKAERRALQENQRAAKGGEPPKPKQVTEVSASANNVAETETAAAAATAASSSQVDAKKSKEITLLRHLPPFRDPEEYPDLFLGVQLGGTTHKKLHPAILETGRIFATDTLLGGNARCRLMLRSLSKAIDDYVPTPTDNGDLRHHLLNQVLKPSFTYWTSECRPHSVSMGNAFTFCKSAVAALDRDNTSLEECKSILRENMEAYIQERIDYADLAIAHVACDKIVNGDVILTYANSEVIRVVLKEAHKTKKFRVIVVDAKPLLEGKALLRDLREAGLECTYILMNALSFVMKDVTKILLGAEALLSDGSVYARVGTACVALSANKDIPVLCCAETYKISNRVQLEAITNNELGNPQLVVEGSPLKDNLRVINLLYDLTPANMISGIVTEMGILPPTSVAVLLREMGNPQDAYSGF